MRLMKVISLLAAALLQMIPLAAQTAGVADDVDVAEMLFVRMAYYGLERKTCDHSSSMYSQKQHRMAFLHVVEGGARTRI